MNRPASCGKDKTLLSGHTAPHSLGVVAMKATRSLTGSELVFIYFVSAFFNSILHYTVVYSFSIIFLYGFHGRPIIVSMLLSFTVAVAGFLPCYRLSNFSLN